MDVNDRIRKELSAAPVVLFMKGTPEFPQCGFSAQTASALHHLGAQFHHVNIFEDPELRAASRWSSPCSSQAATCNDCSSSCW